MTAVHAVTALLLLVTLGCASLVLAAIIVNAHRNGKARVRAAAARSTCAAPTGRLGRFVWAQRNTAPPRPRGECAACGHPACPSPTTLGGWK